jgi:hypothetical protein
VQIVALRYIISPRNIDGMDLEVGGEGVTGPVQNGTDPSIGPAKRVKTGGRKRGTPNKVAGQVRADAGAFFRACTSDNLRFRKKLKEFCESGEVLKHSHTLAVLLSHALGKPTPKVEQGEAKSPLLFISLADPATGAARTPWGTDPLAEKAAALAARKQARMLPEKSAEAYEAPKPGDPPVELEIVEPSLAAQVMARPK